MAGAKRRVAIPRRPVLRGKRWRVVFTRKPGGEPKGVVGLCDRDARTLCITPKLSRREQELTFVHEVLHALWPAGIVDSETEERLVSALEKRLHDALVSGALVAVPDECRR